MTKKTFKNTYSQLYLITPEVYNKVMHGISNRVDKDKTLELNQSENVPTKDYESQTYINFSKLVRLTSKVIDCTRYFGIRKQWIQKKRYINIERNRPLSIGESVL